MRKMEASDNDPHNTTGYTGDAPVCTKITQKSRKESEDAKKSKNFLIMNMQNLKKKGNNIKADTIEQNQINNRNEIKSKVITLEKNQNILNANELESMKTEMKNLNNNMEELNDNLKKVTTELSDEKKNNLALMNSLTATLNKCRNMEFDQKIQVENSYKELLLTKSQEVENVLAEKNDIQNRLEESEITLANVCKEMDSLKEEFNYKLTENAEKLKTIEEESHRWNEYQIELEKLITEGQKALSRKEEYIKHQDFVISNLEAKLLESKESANDTRQPRKLSATIMELREEIDTEWNTKVITVPSQAPSS